MMNITTNTINFKARFVSKTEIKKYNDKTNSYEPKIATIVEIDPKNERDINAMCEIADNWHGQVFVGDIANRAIKLKKGELSGDTNKIYLLTTQKNKLYRLEAGKILGAINVEQKYGEPDEIRYFQVKPNTKYDIKNRKYKNVGKALMNFTKSIYNKMIDLYSSVEGFKFYKCNGFKLIEPDVVKMRWVNKKFI